MVNGSKKLLSAPILI